jgi:hypothetical protein
VEVALDIFLVATELHKINNLVAWQKVSKFVEIGLVGVGGGR